MSEISYASENLHTSHPDQVKPPISLFKIKDNNNTSQLEIDEAYQWHALFQHRWVTAHELSQLPLEAIPAKEGILLKTEAENLLKLKTILDQELSDEEFRAQLITVKDFLPKVFTEMVGMEQTAPHRDIDPVDHTFSALRELNTENLSPLERKIARTVLVFHDVGKVIDPLSREHPRTSAEITKVYLQKMGYTEVEQDKILNQIRWHDALGEVARRDGRNIMDPQDVLTYFSNKQELNLHNAIVSADVKSIPGLSKYVGDIQAVHSLMERRLKAELEWVTIDYSRDTGPFENIEWGQYEAIKDSLFRSTDFDSIEIEDDLDRRKNRFQNIPEIEQKIIEKAVVKFALTNDPELLPALKILGRETDRTLVNELEKNYECDLENIRIANELFSLTYHLWEINHALVNKYSSPDQIEKKLKEIKKSATFLSSYKLEATHLTNPWAIEEIDSTQVLLKSNTSERSCHYEGDGVYLGILGSYRDWAEGKMYTMQIPLADTLPIIVNFNAPKAMCNALSEGLDMKDSNNGLAITTGLIQWRQSQYDNDKIEDWKIKQLETLLGSKVLLTTDEEGKDCVIMDTQEDPIIWSTLCRALRIRRFIPKSQLYKSALPYMSNILYKYNKLVDNTVEIEIPDDPYEIMANEVRHIKGIKGNKKATLY